MRLPGPRAEDGAADLAGARRHDARRAAGGGRAAAAAHADRARAEDRGERSSRRSQERAKPKAPSRPLLGEGLPALLGAVEELRAHPAAEQVSEAGSARRRRETFRDLDMIATATDAKALIDAFTSLDWVVEVVAKGGTKATVISHDGLRFDLRVVPPECYGNLLQHFTGSKDHNVALREEAVRRGLSISEYGDHRRRDGRGAHASRRGGAVRVPRLPVHPARAARERAASSRPRGAGELPELVERARPARRPALALDLVRTGRTRSRRWRSRRRRAATSTSRSPTTRTACATGGWRRRRRRSTR